MCDPIGPMLYGMTYIVRPAIEPENNPLSFALIFAGSSQLLVGPASSLVREQINVRSSTRATSPGSERTKKLDRKSTRLNSSHVEISYAVFCLKKKRNLAALEAK